MENASKKIHTGVGLFLTGVVVGSAVSLGLGNVEGKRMALRLVGALKVLAQKVKEEEVPVREQFPSPPPVLPQV